MTGRLLWDVARCHGVGCARKQECLRREQLCNMGPRTPQYERLCVSGMYEDFIEIVRDDGDDQHR